MPASTYARAGFGCEHPLPERVSRWQRSARDDTGRGAPADEVVLNLVTPERVAATRAAIDEAAREADRTPPPMAVWVPVGVDPGARARAQLASQLAIYLAPPGYGEMFSGLGFGALVEQARAGAKRVELAGQVPYELLERVCALGSEAEVAARLAAYHEAGAAVVGVVPATRGGPGWPARARCVRCAIVRVSGVSVDGARSPQRHAGPRRD